MKIENATRRFLAQLNPSYLFKTVFFTQYLNVAIHRLCRIYFLRKLLAIRFDSHTNILNFGLSCRSTQNATRSAIILRITVSFTDFTTSLARVRVLKFDKERQAFSNTDLLFLTRKKKINITLTHTHLISNLVSGHFCIKTTPCMV